MAITKLSVSTVKNGLLKSNKIWDQTSTFSNAPTNSYFPIASYTVPSGGQASIIFGGIPQTYSHLQVRLFTIVGSAGSGAYTYINGDTTQANYREHVLYGNGTAASAGSYQNSYMPQFCGGSTSPGSFVMDILDYRDTNKNKTLRGLGGYDANGSGYIAFESLLWMNTSAITSLQFSPVGTTWSQYTNISIYGVN
jgi:hypothetical protein